MYFIAVVSTAFSSVVSQSLVCQQKWSLEVKFNMPYSRKLTLKGNEDNSEKFRFEEIQSLFFQ